MIEVQQGRGIWEIIPHLTERQVKDGGVKTGERSVNEYKNVNPILKIIIKMNPPFFNAIRLFIICPPGAQFC